MTALAHLLSHPLAQAGAWTLLHFLWEGLLIGLLAWGTLALMPRRNPGARYGVGLAFLAAMALAPVVTFLLLLPSAQAAPAPVEASAALAGPLPWTLKLKLLLDPSLPAVLAVWSAGVALLSVRFAGSFLYLQRLTSAGVEPAPAEWHLVVARIAREMGLRRAVRLLRSFRVEAPMVVGWLRPVILVPAVAFTGLSHAQVEAVLAHEMAHIRRLDFLVNLIQSGMETLLFFHPAVWWLSSRLRAERELCCDDTAVALCGDRTAYARALATLEGLRDHAPAELRLGADGGSLMNRIRRLLQPQLAPNPRFRSAALALAAAGLLAGTVAQQPKPSTPKAKSADVHRSFTVDRQGSVTITPGAKDPVKVGKDGHYKVQETNRGLTRSYEVTGKDGAVYKVNGVQQPLDEQGRQWLRGATSQGLKPLPPMPEIRWKAFGDGDDLHALNGRLEDMPEVTTIEKDGKRHIIVKRQGKIVTDDEIPDAPEVTMTDEGPHKKHLVLKRDGKVIEDRIIVTPEVTTEERDGRMHIIVKKDGKVTEDRVVEIPKEGAFPRAFVWQRQQDDARRMADEAQRHAMTAEQRAQMDHLRAQMEDLRRQMRELQRQANGMAPDRDLPEPPDPPEAPEAPEPPDAPEAPDMIEVQPPPPPAPPAPTPAPAPAPPAPPAPPTPPASN